MQSLKIFYIEFDRLNAVYMPGEIISGNVVMDLAREKIVRALNLSAKGQANVKWDETTSLTDSNGNSTFSTTTYVGKEIYFSFTVPLLEKTKGDGKVHLPIGLNRYPFNIQLPRDIPCSFEHKNAYIRYTIKTIIDRPWRFDHECKAVFTIITTYDLNIRREQCISICDKINKNFYFLYFINDGSINMDVKLPATGFVPGQWIEAILDLSNISGINLQKICIKLQQSLELHARVKKKHLTETVAAMQKLGPFNKHSVIELHLHIPSIPPSELEFCNIIHLKYILCIILHASKLHRKIVKQYPILIGTIPLLPTPSVPAVSSSPQTSQSTSKMPITSKSDVTPSASCSDSPSTNEFLDAPPSYEECCTNGVPCIKDQEESEYVYGANEPFAPRYPVFKFPTPHSLEK